jgi:hypothetical protein
MGGLRQAKRLLVGRRVSMELASGSKRGDAVHGWTCYVNPRRIARASSCVYVSLAKSGRAG